MVLPFLFALAEAMILRITGGISSATTQLGCHTQAYDPRSCRSNGKTPEHDAGIPFVNPDVDREGSWSLQGILTRALSVRRDRAKDAVFRGGCHREAVQDFPRRNPS